MEIGTTLVELFVCEDPMCGGELYQLIEKGQGDRYSYVSRDPMGEETEILSSTAKLTDEEALNLLDRTNWFHADVAIKNADISGLNDIPRLLGGDWPLFTIGGSLPGVDQRFRLWLEGWIKRNRSLEE